MWLASIGCAMNYVWPSIAFQLDTNNYEWWQLLTYSFSHSNPFHLLINLTGIYSFGCAIEERTGTPVLVLAWLLFSTISGIVHFIPGGVVEGASGALLGLICFLAAGVPSTMKADFYFFKLRLRVLPVVIISVSLVGLLVGSNSIAHDVHLAGAITGWLAGKFLLVRHISKQQ